LLRVAASDADQGLNGLIHYSIVSLSSTFPFAIDSSTGVISLRSSLDYETTRSYRFLIRASDSGLPQSLSTDTWLSISIEDVNDCPVEILFVPHRRFQYDNRTLTIEENLPIDNLTLGYIRLSDEDSLARSLSLTFSVDQTEQEYELFMSNQLDSYVLRVKRGTFDRETQTDVNLHFTASDGLWTSTFDLTIHLLDLNDNPSEFPSNPLRFVLDELANYQMTDQPIEDYQYTIGYLNATDRDQGINALSRYELDANPLVKVDADTGRLYLTQPIDRERLSRIHLQGKAVNVAEPKWSSEVQIQIDM
jgi:protocadherin Fat 4